MDREKLLLVIRPFVIRAARRSEASFKRPYLGFNDYMSIGYLAALKALGRFRPKEGLPPNEIKALWISFASRKIRGAMTDEIRKTRKATRYEEHAPPSSCVVDSRELSVAPDFLDQEQHKAELRTTLRRFLSADEFALADAYFFQCRTQASLAIETGCSQAQISIRWRAILRKLGNNPDFVAYLRDFH